MCLLALSVTTGIYSLLVEVVVLLTQQERRAFERLSLTSQVIINANGVEELVACKDINIEGMSVYLPDNHLKLNDEISVRFRDDTHFPALNVDADVIRVQPITHGFLIALEFIAIY